MRPLLLVALLGPVALAQGEPKKPAAAPARVKPTFESLHVTAAELPEGWSLAKEIATVSPQPATLKTHSIGGQP